MQILGYIALFVLGIFLIHNLLELFRFLRRKWKERRKQFSDEPPAEN